MTGVLRRIVCSIPLAVILVVVPGSNAWAHRARSRTVRFSPGGLSLVSPSVARAAAQRYSFAPGSRTVHPIAVGKTSGTVAAPRAALSGRVTTLTGAKSEVIYDFGRDVGGFMSLHFAGASDAHQTLGMAFSESSQFAGPASDASGGENTGNDGYVSVPVGGAGSYTVPTRYLRGGFRYLTLFMVSGGSVKLNGVSLHFTAAPDLARPNVYPDYFISSDALLNRIWYAGAYTVELDTIPPDEARTGSAPPGGGWDDSASVGQPGSVLTDGAKRDRTIWPGDFVIAIPTDYASLDDLASVKRSLDALYDDQDPDGALPYAGPPLNFPGELSDAYHLDTLIDTADYYMESGDKGWLDGHWTQYARAVAYAIGKTDPATGLFVVSGPADWARSDQGGPNLEANALMYRVLTTCQSLAQAEADSTLATLCAQRAARLKSSVYQLLWDPSAGAYKDDPGGSTTPPTVLYPQDGNALAVWFGLTQSHAQDVGILAHLKKNWTSIGAITPEWDSGKGIHPFPGGMEVDARFTAGDDDDALALIRTEWGYMLRSPLGTGSTFWEGYHTDGNMAGYYNGAYPASYTSLAHGWSTGPTAALSNFVLGITPAVPGGAVVQVVPHAGTLSYAIGCLTTIHGPVDVEWRHSQAGFILHVGAPSGVAIQTVGIPLFGAPRRIFVNGKLAWDGHGLVTGTGVASAAQVGAYVYLRGLSAGHATFVWRSAGRRPTRRGSKGGM